METIKNMEVFRETENLEDDQGHLADELHQSIVDVTGPIYSTLWDSSESNESHLETEKISEEISSKFDLLVPPLQQWKQEKNDKISSLEKSNFEIKAKLQNAEAQMEEDMAKIECLKSQVLKQGTFCSNIGAVLGHLVWRASKEPEMIDFWLSEQSTEKILEQFLGIADTTIAVFFKSYIDVLPPKTRNEYKFARSLLGTFSNISASAKGRQFLIESSYGKCVIKNLVNYFHRVPTPSGLAVKKLILLTLWNMCVNNNCLRYLIELEIGRVIGHCLDESSPQEIKQLGLNILQSITYDLETQLLDQLIETLPVEKIQIIAYNSQDKIAKQAQQILDNIESHDNRTLLSTHQYNDKS